MFTGMKISVRQDVIAPTERILRVCYRKKFRNKIRPLDV
jgi:hypothetical protein